MTPRFHFRHKLLALSLGFGLAATSVFSAAALAEGLSESLSKKMTLGQSLLALANPKKAGDDALAMPMMELEPELDLGQPQPEARPNPDTPPQPTGALKAKAVVVDVNSKTLTYDRDRDVYIATGAVHVVISEQNSELFADQVIYDQNQNLLIAEGHVNIFKNGQKTVGTYAKIDLARQSALINDIATSVEQVRIKAQQSLIGSDYMIFENGRLILTPEMLAGALGQKPVKQKSATANQTVQAAKPSQSSPQSQTVAKGSVSKTVKYDPFTEGDLSKISTRDPLAGSIEGQYLSPVSAGEENPAEDMTQTDFMHIKAKEVDIYRWADGYTKVDLTKPSLYAGKFKLATLSNAQFSQDKLTDEIEYLGPDMGFDPDYGGFYYGPGYDFKLGQGSMRISPLVSYGSGFRKRRGGGRFENPGVGPGIGAALHYRGDDSRLDLSYNSHVDQPVMYAEKFLFDKKTRLLSTINDDYINGFMGFERPGYGVMLSDTRQIGQWGKFRADTFESVGFFKDDFFPNNKVTQLVTNQNLDELNPATAGRIQLQAQIANTEPLLRFGKWGEAGFRIQAAAAGYTTGNLVGLIRGGPSLSMHYKERYRTSLRYFLAYSAGETPFVFDTYYGGRQQLGWSNTVKVNDYVSVGNQTFFSLNRDNAQNALFTGNQFFMLVGPKYVKFNIAYDFIRQRSYFGLMFLPGKDGRPIDYDTMRVHSPDQYFPSPSPVMPR